MRVNFTVDLLPRPLRSEVVSRICIGGSRSDSVSLILTLRLRFCNKATRNTAPDYAYTRPCAQRMRIPWHSCCAASSTIVFGRAGAQLAEGNSALRVLGRSAVPTAPTPEPLPRDFPLPSCTPLRAPVHPARACNTPQCPRCPLLHVVACGRCGCSTPNLTLI